MTGPGSHSLAVTTDKANRYVLWASWASRAAATEPSAAQTAAIADGTVTEAEYRDGFARYRQCMHDAGFSLVGVDESGTIITYSTPGDATTSGDERRCYTQEFGQLDGGWQIAHEYESDTQLKLRACLEAEGVTPARDVAGVEEQLQENNIDPIHCLLGKDVPPTRAP